MDLKRCQVTVPDTKGVEHSAEVTASNLYEAIALGLAALRSSEWADELTRGEVCQVHAPCKPTQQIDRMTSNPIRSFIAYCGPNNSGFRMHQSDLTRFPIPYFLLSPNQAEDHPAVRPTSLIDRSEHSCTTMMSASRATSFVNFLWRAMAIPCQESHSCVSLPQALGEQMEVPLDE